MKVSSPMIAASLMRIEMPTDLAETIGNGTVHQIDELEAAVEIGAPYVRAQGLRLGEGLRPLVIVHEDLSPRGGEKNHRCVRARRRPPGIGRAMPAVAQVADQVGQSAIEETPSTLHITAELGTRAPAIGDLGQHSPA